MEVILIYAVRMFCEILVGLLIAQALMSWFVRDVTSTFGKIYLALVRFTEPIVMPFRKLLSRFNTGMIDFSVLLAIVVIQMAGNMIIRFIVMFF